MITLNLKPVSTNKIWQGKRWMSKEGAQFKKDCITLLRAKQVKLKPLEQGDMSIHFRFGLSRDMDTSNCIKLVEDCIALALGVDDIRFRGMTATKERVEKGHEFIAVEITDYLDQQFLPSPPTRERP